MTTVYLAYATSANRTLAKHAADAPVDLLVAYPSLPAFLKARREFGFNIRRWCLDSGAFSVWNSGKVIDPAEYDAACLDVDADEIFGLDVIGDAEKTQRNLEGAWARGIPAIPTFHIGEPWEALAWCAANAAKIALGGMARHGRDRPTFVRQCFARVWPKPIHGFAMASREMIGLVPFDSVDASSWCYAPSKMGHWAGYTGRQIALPRAPAKDVWIEVLEHQKRARWAEARWARELALARSTRCSIRRSTSKPSGSLRRRTGRAARS